MPFFISLVILKIKTKSITIDKIDNSNPLKGRNDNTAALIPKSERSPIPHVAQPGVKIPRKIPIVAKKPVFLDNGLTISVLYAIRLNKIPKKILIRIMLIKTLRNVVFLNPIKRAKKSLIVPNNPI